MGPVGGYRLEAVTSVPPLLLDDDEAVAVIVGLHTAAVSSVAGSKRRRRRRRSSSSEQAAQRHFDDVVSSDGNIARTFDDDYGDYQIRDSLFAGPGGFLHFETTWQITDGGLRLTTVIPKGGR
jgi:hypothetical protein